MSRLPNNAGRRVGCSGSTSPLRGAFGGEQNTLVGEQRQSSGHARLLEQISSIKLSLGLSYRGAIRHQQAAM